MARAGKFPNMNVIEKHGYPKAMGFPEKLQCWMILGSDILGCRTKNNSCSPAKPGNKPSMQRRVFKTKDVLLLSGHQARIWWLSQGSRVIQLPKSGQAQRNVLIKSEGSPILIYTFSVNPLCFGKTWLVTQELERILGIPVLRSTTRSMTW